MSRSISFSDIAATTILRRLLRSGQVDIVHGHGAKVTGELIITSLEVFSPLLAPVIAGFQAEHDDLMVKFLTDTRVFRLEYGEAHVAIRAGNKPEDPDNVVQQLKTQKIGFYASKDYLKEHGSIDPDGDFAGHRMVGYLSASDPFWSIQPLFTLIL